MSETLRKEVVTRSQFIAWLENRISKRLARDFDVYDSLCDLLKKEQKELDEIVHASYFHA